jgi:WD40 repeat protein
VAHHFAFWFAQQKTTLDHNSEEEHVSVSEVSNPANGQPSRSLFLSYARKDDEPFVQRLYRDLTDHGFQVWWDRENMDNDGRTFRHDIREGIIIQGERLVLVVGPAALASPEVAVELKHARSNCKPVVSILRIGEYESLPDELRAFDVPDFRDDGQYGEKLKYLLRQLSMPIAPLGDVETELPVPSLPPHFVPRSDDVKGCKEPLLAETKEAVVITARERNVGVHGMGGVGKTVLASAVARDCDVRRVFPDGIFWIGLRQTLGDEDLVNLQTDLCNALGYQPPPPDSQDEELLRQDKRLREGDTEQRLSARKQLLKKMLAQKACLIVLDDAWDRSHAEAFDVTTPRSSLLVTTRNSRVVAALGAKEHLTDVLSDEQALDLLARWADEDVAALPPEAREVIRECGNLPLAVSMIGGLVRESKRWDDALDRLRNARLDYIGNEDLLPYQYKNLMIAIQVSVDALKQVKMLKPLDVCRHFLDLAVFQDDTLIPETTLEILWEPDGLNALDARDVINHIVTRSLARRDKASLRLHDLTRDYIRNQFSAESLFDAHNRLLAAYRQKYPDGWHTCPDDGYIFQQLTYHMSEAGQAAELRSLLTDVTFLQTKISLLKTGQLLPDFGHLSDDSDVRRIHASLVLGASVLDEDPAELSNQLYGRLGPVPALHNPPPQKGPAFTLLSQTLFSPDARSLSSLKGHKGSVHGCAFDCDGQRLVSASADSTLRVWNVHTGETSLLLEGHAGSVNGCAFDGRGDRIASASDDRTVRLWDVHKGNELRKLASHDAAVNSCAFSPRDNLLVSASDDYIVRLWNVARDEAPHVLRGHRDSVLRCAFSPDGQLIVSASKDRTLRIWDVRTERELRVLSGHEDAVHGCVFSPDGTLIASASNDHTVRIWDAATGAPVRVLAGHASLVHGCAFSPDGTRLLSGSSDYKLRLWDVATGDCLNIVNGHETWVNDCAFSPRGDVFASTCYDGTLRIWDAKEVRTLIEMPSEMSYIRGCAIAPSAQFAFDGDRKGLRVWRLADQQLMQVLPDHAGYVSACAASPDGGWVLSASADGTLRVWDTATWRCTHVLRDHDDIVYGCAVSPDGHRAISASADRTLLVWDTATWQAMHSLAGHSHLVRGCAFSPDSKLAVSTSWDKTGRLWDVESGKVLRVLEGHAGNVRGCRFSSDGKYVLTASYDRTLRLWDVESGQFVRQFAGHESWVFDCAFVDDEWIMSAADDKTLRLWAIDSGRQIAIWHADAPLTCCDLRCGGASIITGDSLGNLHILRLNR